jgi:uncharacterized protein with von Willebrand factor type A (vWA) domain
MISALARFVEAMRAENHAVSPAEIIDASRALDLVGLERRAEVRSALRATLAKDRRAAAAFDRLFDRFFATPVLPAKGERAGRVGGPSGRRRPGDGDPSEASREKPKAKPGERARASEPVSGGRRPAEPSFAELTATLRHGHREGERRRGRLRRARLRPSPSPVGEDVRDAARRDLARRMTTEEERAVAREIPRMVQALKLRIGRRMASARTGRPWLRRALRTSLKSGGVPFVMPYRAPKRRNTRVVLLVDVSYSVARAAGLFLLMASAFLELGRRARVLAFVGRPVDATTTVARWSRGASHRCDTPAPRRPRPIRAMRPSEGVVAGGVSFAEVLDGLQGLDLEAPSDYGTAFHALRSPRLAPRGRDTVLVVLGDGRTNRYDPLPWALADLARGCRCVLWLVPEPRSRWGTADSALPAYLASVDVVVEANDLHGLAAGLGELVRRL